MHFMHQDKHALCMLKEMTLSTPKGEETLENLIKSGYFWCSSIPVDTPVTIYGAANDARGCLVNCNNYVAFFTDTGEVKTENNSTVNIKSDNNHLLIHSDWVWAVDGMFCWGTVCWGRVLFITEIWSCHVWWKPNHKWEGLPSPVQLTCTDSCPSIVHWDRNIDCPQVWSIL